MNNSINLFVITEDYTVGYMLHLNILGALKYILAHLEDFLWCTLQIFVHLHPNSGHWRTQDLDENCHTLQTGSFVNNGAW